MTDDEDEDLDGGAPAWLRAMEQRLVFFAQGERSQIAHARRVIEEARAAGSSLQAFLHATLDVYDAAIASRDDLRGIRPTLSGLSALARAAIDGDRDDRPLLARARALDEAPAPGAWAARAPCRVVWLAAMADVPGEEGGAAAMLVNDLAALDPALPLRALRAACAARPAKR